jgi:hypothetical protein
MLCFPAAAAAAAALHAWAQLSRCQETSRKGRRKSIDAFVASRKESFYALAFSVFE